MDELLKQLIDKYAEQDGPMANYSAWLDGFEAGIKFAAEYPPVVLNPEYWAPALRNEGDVYVGETYL